MVCEEICAKEEKERAHMAEKFVMVEIPAALRKPQGSTLRFLQAEFPARRATFLLP